MKKTMFIFSLTVSLLVFSTFLIAQPTFQAGLGGQILPGQYDYNLLSKYLTQKNNGNIDGIDSNEVSPVTYFGVSAFGSMRISNFMIMLTGSLNFPGKITVTYNDTSSGTVVPYTVEHKALYITGTLWMGPSIDIMGKGSIYLCTGPSFMYAEWRDKVDAGETGSIDETKSKDRQYKGMGVILPFMVGGEGFITKKIGVRVELIMLAQQIMLETFSKTKLSDTDSTYDLITFPIGFGTAGSATTPAIFLTRLSLVYHIN